MKIVIKFLGVITLISHQFLAFSQIDSVIIKNYNAHDFKVSEKTYSGVSLNDGTLYFANESGLIKFDGSRWMFIGIKDLSPVFSLEFDESNRVYVGGQGEVGYLNTENDEYVSLTDKIRTKTKINEIWQIIKFENDVYFSSYEVILRYDGENFHEIDLENAHIFLCNDKIVASVFGGAVYELRNDSTVRIGKTIKNFNDDAAYGIVPYTTSDKHLILTSETGVFLFDSKNRLIEPIQIPISNQLVKYNVYDAKVWRDSLYVISTWLNGVFIVDKKGELVKKITTDDGLQTDEQREILIDKRGNLWSCSNEGISNIKFKTEKLVEEFQPKSKVTNLKYRYTSDSIVSNIIFEFSTPGYDQSEVKHSFKLDGYDESFSAWSHDIKKEYTNLNGGDYTFLVRTLLPTGEVTESSSMSVYLPTPWYKNTWFFVLVGFIFIAIVMIIYNVRNLQLKKQNLKLENLINQRTKEIVDQQRQLELANASLQIKNSELDNFVYRSSHDLVAPLKSIRGLVNIARLDSLETHLDTYFDQMNSSILKLEEFIKSIMEYSTNTNSATNIQDIDLSSTVDLIIDDLKYYTGVNKIEFLKNIPERFALRSDRKRINIIVSNLITNSIKYHNYNQDNPYIKISAENRDDKAVIQIEDNGTGIEKEHLSNIFNMFYRAADKGEGSGLGLYIVKDTIAKLNGKIEVTSTVNQGTSFTLTFPV